MYMSRVAAQFILNYIGNTDIQPMLMENSNNSLLLQVDTREKIENWIESVYYLLPKK